MKKWLRDGGFGMVMVWDEGGRLGNKAQEKGSSRCKFHRRMSFKQLMNSVGRKEIDRFC